MDKKLTDALLTMRKYGARIYLLPTGDKVIHVGGSELQAVAEALLTQRCGCLRETRDGETVIILKGEKHDK